MQSGICWGCGESVSPPCWEHPLTARQTTSANEMETIFFVHLFCVPSVQAGILSLLCSPGETLLAEVLEIAPLELCRCCVLISRLNLVFLVQHAESPESLEEKDQIK